MIGVPVELLLAAGIIAWVAFLVVAVRTEPKR